MSSCGENLFQPGLSCVRCPDAPGTKSKEMPRKKPAASPRYAPGQRSPRLALPLRVFDFDSRMLTTASENVWRGRMALLDSRLLQHPVGKKRKSPGGWQPGQNLTERRKLNYRAMRGVGSGESVTPGASADLPLLDGAVRAGTTGSGLRVGSARF